MRQQIEHVLAALVAGGLIVLLLVGLLVVRRYLLARKVGSFDCALRTSTPGRTGVAIWSPGVARYESDRLDWYSFVGVCTRPNHVIPRQGLQITGHREARAPERSAIHPGWVVVTCGAGERRIDIAMEPGAYSALAMWLESAPPGQHSHFS